MSEEQKLIDNYNAATRRVKRIKALIAKLQLWRNQAEKAEAKAEAAYIAFMDECGIKESECGDYKTFIRYGEQVDIANVEAVPDCYMRTKIVREPDKQKIKANAEGLEGRNWFSIKRVRNLQVKLKG